MKYTYMSVLLTGAFGFLGKTVLAFLLHDSRIHSIVCLVRGKRNKSIEKRLSEILTELGISDEKKKLQCYNQIYPIKNSE
jgi:thioester reductase-like protein